MNYKEFSKIWDEVMSDHSQRKGKHDDIQLVDTMSDNTEKALIAYANGDKSHFNRVREILDKNNK